MIRGTKRKVTGQKGALNIDLPVNIHNRFDIEVIDAKSGEVKQRAKAFNVITNNLWSNLAAKKAYFSYIHYGTGSGTPSSEDTQLFSFLGALAVSSSNISLDIDFDNHFISYRNYIQLNPETAVGQTITEVGIGQSATASTLCTHAMLQDMNGNQISILKSDTDIINIYATVFVHWSHSDNGIEFLYPASFSDISRRTYYRTLADFLGGINSDPDIYAYIYNTPVRAFGYNGNPTLPEVRYRSTVDMTGMTEKKMVLTFPRVDVNSANFDTGIRQIFLCTQVKSGNSTAFVPELAIYAPSEGAPATRVIGESIATGDGETIKFRTKFGYAKDAVIYVDGVAASEVIVNPNSPSVEKISRVLRYVPEASTDYYNCFPDSSPQTYTYTYPTMHRTQPNGTAIATFYNPCWEFGWGTYNLKSAWGPKEYSLSDDLINWTLLTGSTNNQGVNEFPEELRYKKYIRIDNSSGSPIALLNPTFYDVDNALYNIHFDTPPAVGAVITADYTTDITAKDENHVFDLTVTIQLGEYTEN